MGDMLIVGPSKDHLYLLVAALAATIDKKLDGAIIVDDELAAGLSASLLPAAMMDESKIYNDLCSMPDNFSTQKAMHHPDRSQYHDKGFKGNVKKYIKHMNGYVKK
jgi:hypothetical protein